MKNFTLHPATSKPRKRKSLVETDIDKIGQAILTLTKEIWTLADRQIITENILDILLGSQSFLINKSYFRFLRLFLSLL